MNKTFLSNCAENPARDKDKINGTSCGMSFSLDYLMNTFYASGAKVCITDTGMSDSPDTGSSRDLLAAIRTGQQPLNPFNALATASAQQEPAPDMTEKR